MNTKNTYEKYHSIVTEVDKLNLQKVQDAPSENIWCAIRTDDYPLVEVNLFHYHKAFPIWLMIIYDETVLIHHNVAQLSVAETMSIIKNTLIACEHLKAAHDITGNHEMGRDN